MTQNLLNYCVILNKEALIELSLTESANEFCRESETRLKKFGKFNNKDIPQQLCNKISLVIQTFQIIFSLFWFWILTVF